jgi:large subunit ribosomal protein L33
VRAAARSAPASSRRSSSKTMRDLITLNCDSCKRKNYTTSKNKKTMTDKLSLKKFCPACRCHTLHKEGKV